MKSSVLCLLIKVPSTVKWNEILRNYRRLHPAVKFFTRFRIFILLLQSWCNITGNFIQNSQELTIWGSRTSGSPAQLRFSGLSCVKTKFPGILPACRKASRAFYWRWSQGKRKFRFEEGWKARLSRVLPHVADSTPRVVVGTIFSSSGWNGKGEFIYKISRNYYYHCYYYYRFHHWYNL